MITDNEVPVINRAQERAAVKAGYSGGKRVYRLTFEDPDMDGFVLRAKSVSMRKLLDLARLDTTVIGRAAHDLSDEDVELLLRILGDFAGCIVEWNLLDDDGEAVEPTVDNLLDQDPNWVLRVFMVWMTAIAGVSAPLARPSGNGQQFPGGSVPMAPPSTSPPS